MDSAETIPNLSNVQNAAIWTRDLTRKFGEQVAVDRINLIVPRGKIFGFIGPSGSGKTTTIRMMTGTYKPTAGEVYVLNVPPRTFDSSMREKIGYMPQLFVLYPELTVWENLNFTAALYGMFFGRNKRLKELLEFVEMGEDRHKLVRNISGGMQRRLSLAATLAHDPELLFLDEPTAGIDPILRRKFWDLFRELQGQGRTFFITTQYVSEAAYCDLVGVLAEGRLIAFDTPEGLRRQAYGGDLVELFSEEPIPYPLVQQIQGLPFVHSHRLVADNQLRLTVEEAATAVPQLLEWSQGRQLTVKSIEEYIPPYDDVFVKLVEKETNGG